MPSFLGMKKGNAYENFEGTMHPVFRCSLTKFLHVSISWGLRKYILEIFGVNDDKRSMVWL